MIDPNDRVAEVELEAEELPKGRRAGGMTPRQIDGVPHVHALPLTPLRLSQGAEHVFTTHGLYLGVRVLEDATISFAPVPAPVMPFKRGIVRVEFTSDLEETEETVCELQVLYLTREPKTLVAGSLPMIADGQWWGCPIPASVFRPRFVAPIALKVILLGEKRPVLVRGASIEFPGERAPEE